MPSPALNDYTFTTPPPGRYEQWRNGVIYGGNPVYFSGLASKTEYLTKPATVENPVRPDGTRPMSAYVTTWFRQANIAPVSSVQNFGWFENKYFDYPRIDVVSSPSNPAGLAQGWRAVSAMNRFAAEQEATTRTLGKLSQKKWDLGVTALEMKQTVGLVADLAQSFAKTVDQLVHSHRRSEKVLQRFFRRVQHHGDFYQAAAEVGLKDMSLLEDIRSRWMQYQFGIKPLVYDSYDASVALSDLIHNHGLSVLVRAKAGASRKARTTLSQSSRGDPVLRTLIGEEEVKVHYSVVYEMPTGSTGPINTLGLDNPWSIGWEVTRLSWMFDYVVDIGSWLSSFSAINGMTFREGCRSELLRCRYHTSLVQPSSSNVTLVSRGERPCFVESGRFERSLLAAPGLVPAVIPIPRKELGLIQLGNSLFALSSVFQGSPGLR